jgi:Na+-driven multidrug efflux pump
MLASGSAYLRAVAPFYGMYGLGFALYFASQGAGRLLWPLLAGLSRMLIATVGGWLVLTLTGSQAWLFAALAVGLVVYGIMIPVAILRGAWLGRGLKRDRINTLVGSPARRPAPAHGSERAKRT